MNPLRRKTNLCLVMWTVNKPVIVSIPWAGFLVILVKGIRGRERHALKPIPSVARWGQGSDTDTWRIWNKPT